MNDKFIRDVLNEIDEKYIDEAIKIQQRRKKQMSRFLIPLAASVALIMIAGTVLFRNHGIYNETLEKIEAEIDEHAFSLVVYAAENSKETVKETPEEFHKYIISSNHGNIANKIYTLTSVSDMPEKMRNRIDLSEELVLCFGFNLRVEGEEIESITYEAVNTEFVKKVDYNWGEDTEIFQEYPECLGIASKEYFNGSNGKEYENCGNTELKHWLFVPKGKSYTVPYAEQGSPENLYALKLVYDREKIEKANEYSGLNTEDHYQTINDALMDKVLGQKIKVIINYTDGCRDEMIVEITHSGGMYMEIEIIEMLVNYNDFDDVTELLDNENGEFHIKLLERDGNGWKALYRNVQ